MLEYFTKYLTFYQTSSNNGVVFQHIEKELRTSSDLLNIITEFNDHYTKRQVNYIKKTLEELEFINNNFKTTKDKNIYIKDKLQQNMVYCEKWCNTYNLT